MVFFLDDGVVAGEAEAAKHLGRKLLTSLAEVGLHMALDKCEVVPAAGAENISVDQECFVGWKWMPGSGIKVLGAPIFNEEFCAALTSKRVTKARTLLQEVGDAHTQGALQALRHCASWGNLV
jgi:hypothetical protein